MALPLLGPALGGIAIALSKFLIPYIITRIIIAIGLTIITYVGVDLLTTFVVDQVWAATIGLPSDIAAILVIAGAFDWLAVVLAAWVAAVQIKMLRGGFKRISIL